MGRVERHGLSVFWWARKCSPGVGKGFGRKPIRSSCIRRIDAWMIRGPDSVSDDGLTVPGGAIASVLCHDSPVSHAGGPFGRQSRSPVYLPRSGSVQGAARRFAMTGGFRNVGSRLGGPLGQGLLRWARNDVAPIAAPAAAAISPELSPAPRIWQRNLARCAD
jgi:hypothetical protein